jgi:hypothetical protein
MIGLVVIAAALVSAASANANVDPLEQAKSGGLQCYTPNLEHKTCRVMSGYILGAEGTIASQSTVLVAPDPPVTMTTLTPVTIKDSAECGVIRETDIQSAQFTVSARPATPDQTVRLRAQMLEALKSQFGSEVCTSFPRVGDSVRASVTINGVAHPEASDVVIWVQPSDGFTVGK